MPKKDFWTTMKERVQNYQEDPADDTWDKIAGAIPPPAAGIGISRKMMSIALLLVLGSITGTGLLYWSDSSDFDRITKVLKEDSGAALSRPLQSIASDTHSGESHHQNPASSVIPKESNSPTTSTKVSKDAITGQRRGIIEGVESSSNQEKKARRFIAASTTKPATSTIKFEDQHAGETNITGGAVETYVSEAVESNGKVASGDQATSRNSERSAQVSQLISAKMTADEIKEDSLGKRAERKVLNSPTKQMSEKQRKVFHGAFYASLTPSFSFQKIIPVNNDGVEVIGFESPGVMHKDRFGFSFDIGYERAITQRLEWYAGLSLYRQNQSLIYRYNSKDEFDLKSDGNGGFTLVPKMLFKSFDYNMTNTGVAAGLRYTIKNSGLKHKFGAGLQFQKGMLSSDEEQSSYNNADAFYLNYQLTYRLEFRVRPNLDLFMQPSFTHAIISNESLNEPFKLKPYRAGVGLGVVYHF